MKVAVINTVLTFAMVLTVWALFRAALMLWPVIWPLLACLIVWAVIALVMSRMK